MLDEHATTMPRVTLRFALEHFGAEERAEYMGRKGAVRGTVEERVVAPLRKI
jgi:hypothetical protein